MIATLPYVPTPPGQEAADRTWGHLNEAQRERFLDIAGYLTAILAPLAQVTSTSSLEDALQTRVSSFGQRALELLELLWPTLEEFKGHVGIQYENVRIAVAAKSDLLGEEATQALLGAIDSDEGLAQWVIRASEQGSRGTYKLMFMAQQAGKSALHAAMCINTLMGILTDRITHWQPEAIDILAAAADDYMTEVEDVFLSQIAAVEESEAEETVEYDALRRELGL